MFVFLFVLSLTLFIILFNGLSGLRKEIDFLKNKLAKLEQSPDQALAKQLRSSAGEEKTAAPQTAAEKTPPAVMAENKNEENVRDILFPEDALAHEPAALVKEAPSAPLSLPVDGESKTNADAVFEKPLADAALTSPAPARKSKDAFEMFTGAKLFAWIGGFAAFLAVVFFVKYSIDNGLLSPFIRIVIGYIAALACLIAGYLIKNEALKVTRGVMYAMGIVFLYAVTYAGSILYGLFPIGVAFVIMTATSALSFFIAVKTDSKYTAVLGAVGGYLTPVLLSTGGGRVEALCAYYLMIGAACLHVGLKKKWQELFGVVSAVSLIAIGIYNFKFLDNASHVKVTLCSISQIILLTVYTYLAAKNFVSGFAFRVMPALAIIIAMPYALVNDYSLYGQLAYILCLNAALLALFIRNGYFKNLFAAGGIVAYVLLLCVWPGEKNTAQITSALCFYIGFAVVNTVVPLWKYYKEKVVPGMLTGLYPCFLLLPLIVSTFNLGSLFSVFLIFIFGFFTVAFALLRNNIAFAIIGVAASFVTLFIWWFNCGSLGDGALLIPVVFAGFVILLMHLNRNFVAKWFAAFNPSPDRPENSQLAFERVFTVMLLSPYIMLVSFLIISKPYSPNAFFTASAVLTILIYAATFKAKDGFAQLCALIGNFFVQAVWFFACYKTAHAKIASITVGGCVPPLGGDSFQTYTAYAWFFGVFAAALAVPFIWRKRFENIKSPWLPAAFVGPLQFILIYLLSKQYYYGGDYFALLPAFFAAVYLFACICVHERNNADEGVYNMRYGTFAAVALLFISLIFPVQFSKQWLTASWAVEGAALIWLYGHIKFPGLKKWSIGLLSLCFVRVAFPFALDYEVMAGSLLNWYLYIYAIVTASLYAAAKLWTPADDKIMDVKCRPYLAILATVLLFILINVEIAAYFSNGSSLSFEFSGNFARDMSYTLAWGLFAIALFAVGLLKKIRLARISAIVLLGSTVLKLFLHDIWYLRQLYRVGALLGLAVILIVTAFMYQKYIGNRQEQNDDGKAS